MANKAKELNINGTSYSFIGETWYGECSTSATTQTKLVTINGFTSSNLVNGTRVVVRFSNYQGYNGTPKLNVNSTGAKDITDAERYEWGDYSIIGFVYLDGSWRIEDGIHATESRWGKTKLSYYVSSDYTTAITPYGIKNASNEFIQHQWIGDKNTHPITLLDSSTPDASEWIQPSGAQYKMVTLNDIDMSQLINENTEVNRIIKTTYGDFVFYRECPLYENVNDIAFIELGHIWDDEEDRNALTILINNADHIDVMAYDDYIGEFDVTVEYFYESDAGFVSYPVLDGVLPKAYNSSTNPNGYLTMSDLPIYDGSVT